MTRKITPTTPTRSRASSRKDMLDLIDRFYSDIEDMGLIEENRCEYSIKRLLRSCGK